MLNEKPTYCDTFKFRGQKKGNFLYFSNHFLNGQMAFLFTIKFSLSVSHFEISPDCWTLCAKPTIIHNVPLSASELQCTMNCLLFQIYFQYESSSGWLDKSILGENGPTFECCILSIHMPWSYFYILKIIIFFNPIFVTAN